VFFNFPNFIDFTKVENNLLEKIPFFFLNILILFQKIQNIRVARPVTEHLVSQRSVNFWKSAPLNFLPQEEL
jgi:hypothetical protein